MTSFTSTPPLTNKTFVSSQSIYDVKCAGSVTLGSYGGRGPGLNKGVVTGYLVGSGTAGEFSAAGGNYYLTAYTHVISTAVSLPSPPDGVFARDSAILPAGAVVTNCYVSTGGTALTSGATAFTIGIVDQTKDFTGVLFGPGSPRTTEINTAPTPRLSGVKLNKSNTAIAGNQSLVRAQRKGASSATVQQGQAEDCALTVDISFADVTPPINGVVLQVDVEYTQLASGF